MRRRSSELGTPHKVSAPLRTAGAVSPRTAQREVQQATPGRRVQLAQQPDDRRRHLDFLSGIRQRADGIAQQCVVHWKQNARTKVAFVRTRLVREGRVLKTRLYREGRVLKTHGLRRCRGHLSRTKIS